VGTLLLGGGNGFVMLGERTVPSGLAALVIASVPLVLVLMRLAAGERVPRDLLAGVALGLVGVGVLVVPSGVSGAIDPLGLALIVTATLSWSLGTFISPRLDLPRNVFASTAWQMLCAGVVMLVLGAAVGELGEADPSRFTTGAVVALVYLVIFGSLAAFSAYTWLLQHASVSLISTYAYVNPVIAVFLGTVFLAEPLSPTTIAGSVLILAAVAFIVTRTAAARRAAAT
jgi:drug/metabolite transporter (DMT)-like permease